MDGTVGGSAASGERGATSTIGAGSRQSPATRARSRSATEVGCTRAVARTGRDAEQGQHDNWQCGLFYQLHATEMSSRPPADLKGAIVTELAPLAPATTATSGDLNVDVDAGWRITRSTLMLERIS